MCVQGSGEYYELSRLETLAWRGVGAYTSRDNREVEQGIGGTTFGVTRVPGDKG